MENYVDTHSDDFLLEFGIFMACSVLDVLSNTAAGAAAAAAGAQAQGAPVTSFIIATGARAGGTKAGILFLAGLSSFAQLHPVMQLLVYLTLNTFAAAVVTAILVSQYALGTTSEPLIVAAIVATIPAMTEFQVRPVIWFIHPLIGVMAGPGLDALAGYVFARMSHNGGLDVCDYNSAAIAGAVYGSVTLVYHLTTTLVYTFYSEAYT